MVRVDPGRPLAGHGDGRHGHQTTVGVRRWPFVVLSGEDTAVTASQYDADDQRPQRQQIVASGDAIRVNPALDCKAMVNVYSAASLVLSSFTSEQLYRAGTITPHTQRRCTGKREG